MKIFLYIVLTLIILNQPGFSDDKNSVEELLKSKLDAVFVVLQKNNLEQEAKNSQDIDIVAPMFDFSLMAKLTLGRKHWPGLSQENKEIINPLERRGFNLSEFCYCERLGFIESMIMRRVCEEYETSHNNIEGY